MASTLDVDFHQIAPRCGGQREAFEELCCQLAHRTTTDNSTYVRLHGAGGDGGVECFAETSNSDRIGWQAKYVFDIESLLKQVAQSFKTALDVHPTLNRYVVCFPFDLTGSTRRRGLSSSEKFDEWRRASQEKARKCGRQVEIEIWPSSFLRGLLLKYDPSGGIREYFFNRTVLTNEQFIEHLASVEKTAGPRYTPELSVRTNLWKWCAAFGRSDEWSRELENMLRTCRTNCDRFLSRSMSTQTDLTLSDWPNSLHSDLQLATSEIISLFDNCASLISSDDRALFASCVSSIDHALERLTYIESELTNDLETKYGSGKASSPGFRQFMAEHLVSFPTANLDDTTKAITSLKDARNWLRSEDCSLAYERSFVLSGAAGVGKTHGLCDAAKRRLDDGLLTCVIFGHAFQGQPDPWTRLSESLGLPITLGMNGVLAALNAAGEATARPLVICIDAVNETRPRRYWRERLASFSMAIARLSHVRLIVSCRTSYLPICIPERYDPPVVEYLGFSGIEHHACREFFQYYGLEAPIEPILQPELSNPLYLRLLCTTLQSKGLSRIPKGWRGLIPTIKAFLNEKEERFSVEHETSVMANVVKGSLKVLAREIADSRDTMVSASKAQEVISNANPRARSLPVLDWLIREDLLIEDAPCTDQYWDEESSIRLAFERLGDFLIASEILDRVGPDNIARSSQQGELLHSFWSEPAVVARNRGILAALSIIIPEIEPDLELPDLVDDEQIRRELIQIAVQAFTDRNPASISEASASILQEALKIPSFAAKAMDTVLSVSWQPSKVDALWLDEFLKLQPLASRDAVWCHYLHDRFETRGSVHRLIVAVHELSLEGLDPEIAKRWCSVLLWFTAAADRRVKDKATRAATEILAAQPKILAPVLTRFITCDDDEVKERALLSCYGALILSRNSAIVRPIIALLQENYIHTPQEFDNALIRDDIKSIADLGHFLDVLPENTVPHLSMCPIASKWPLSLPTQKQLETWAQLIFTPNEFQSDFFKYSMNCLRPWEHAIRKSDMAAWILQRAAHHLGYQDSGCEKYDKYMLSKYGGGRGKPAWAERIGKKYQWIAMYQLASRLYDHVEKQPRGWEPEPSVQPYILLEERKLDPTIRPYTVTDTTDKDSWWLARPQGFGQLDICSDEEWVYRETVIPSLSDLVSVVRHSGQKWRVLVSHSSRDNRNHETRLDGTFRDSWMQVRSYLVCIQDVDAVFEFLHRRNFFGNWMPEATSWSYGFVGEYPWAAPFKPRPEEREWSQGDEVTFPSKCEPSWNEINIEWEYDPTLPSSSHVVVPSDVFFVQNNLWWNGQDGHRLIGGQTVFRDPSISEGGPASLLADDDEFRRILEQLGMSIVWTLYGGKWILGGHDSRNIPRKTFSQIACLNGEGSLDIGEKVFFDT